MGARAHDAALGWTGLEDLGVRTHLGMRAVALRPGEVELADGATLHADAIVVATGLAARTLPGQPTGVHTLRTLDDALALRAALERASSLLVIGGGFIGAEVASSARTRGLAVTVLEALPVPSARALGRGAGRADRRLMTEAGVDLRTADDGHRRPPTPRARCGRRAGGRVAGDGRRRGGRHRRRAHGWGGWTARRTRARPRRPALRGDGAGRRVAGVWAVGDVAAWTDPSRGDRHRHEHWTSAGDQAATVARDILGEPPPPARVPYFWSDQFGLKIQLFGRPEHADTAAAAARRRPRGRRGARHGGRALLADGRLVAVAGFGAARFVARYRALLLDGADGAAALELASTLRTR